MMNACIVVLKLLALLVKFCVFDDCLVYFVCVCSNAFCVLKLYLEIILIDPGGVRENRNNVSIQCDCVVFYRFTQILCITNKVSTNVRMIYWKWVKKAPFRGSRHTKVVTVKGKPMNLTYRLEEGAGHLIHSHRRSVAVLVWASKLALGPISRQNLSEKWLLPNY